MSLHTSGPTSDDWQLSLSRTDVRSQTYKPNGYLETCFSRKQSSTCSRVDNTSQNHNRSRYPVFYWKRPSNFHCNARLNNAFRQLVRLAPATERSKRLFRPLQYFNVWTKRRGHSVILTYAPSKPEAQETKTDDFQAFPCKAFQCN